MGRNKKGEPLIAVVGAGWKNTTPAGDVLAHDAGLKRAADGLQHSGAVHGADRLEIAADGSASRKTRNPSASPGARAAGLSRKRVLDRVGDEQVAKMGRRDGRFLDLGKGRLNNGRA